MIIRQRRVGPEREDEIGWTDKASRVNLIKIGKED